MITPAEMIDVMENLGYNTELVPERSLQNFMPSDDALPLLVPVSVEWPMLENGERFECRMWIQSPQVAVDFLSVLQFLTRFNWSHAPWKLLFNDEENLFCLQMVWPSGVKSLTADAFFNDLLAGCCLIHCITFAMQRLAEDFTVEKALFSLDEEFESLAKLVSENIAEEDAPKKTAAKPLPKKSAAKQALKPVASKKVSERTAPVKKAVAKKTSATKTVKPKKK